MPRALASACLIDTDCDAPLVCTFQRCHAECTANRDCAAGSRCVLIDGLRHEAAQPSGTTAIDSMGAMNGTYGGSVGHDAPGAIALDPDSAVALDGTTAYPVLVRGYSITVSSGGTSFERWRDTSTSGSFGVPLTVGAYNHIVATFDGAQTILYINGVATAPSPSSQILSTSTEACNVGTYSSPGPGNFVQGTIDDVAFYDHALSPARVAAHYASGTRL